MRVYARDYTHCNRLRCGWTGGDVPACTQIVVSETAADAHCTSNMLPLLELLADDLPRTQITTIDRKYFNDARGLHIIEQLAVAECSTLHNNIADKCVRTCVCADGYTDTIVWLPRRRC
jgi:hypothetical protein